MDNIRFGAFVAQLRKELGLTQKELADRLKVTDKAVSKWETGKGFPDIHMLEPLAQALGVSLVELIRGERQENALLTVAEAEQVVSQAMDQSQMVTARRYLRWFRWTLTGVALFCTLHLFPHLIYRLERLYFDLVLSKQYGVIGGADGPTAILIASRHITFWNVVIPLILLVLSVLMALRVRKLERNLK